MTHFLTSRAQVTMNIFYLILLYHFCLVNSSTFYDSCTWCLLTRKEFVKVEYPSLSQPIYQCLGSSNQTIPLIILRNATITSITNCTWEKIGLLNNRITNDDMVQQVDQDLSYYIQAFEHAIKIFNHTIPLNSDAWKNLSRQESVGE